MADLPVRDVQTGNVEATLTHSVEVHTRHSGPLPDPATLKAYDLVEPGLAGKIVSMAEREQAHAHRREIMEARQPYLITRRGQLYGLFALIILGVLAGYLAHLGHPGWSTGVGTLDVVAIVSVFVTGNAAEKPDKKDEGKPSTDAD